MVSRGDHQSADESHYFAPLTFHSTNRPACRTWFDGRDTITVNPELFRNNVAKALEELPDEFRSKMENVEIIVEEFPDRETIETVGAGSRWNLLGLYVGVPITERSVFSLSILPERIYLYRRPILRAAGVTENVVDTIRDVFIHEVGHHFGFDDDELAEMAGHGE